MNIRELRDLLNKEIEKGNGDAEVGYISCNEPCLCSLSEEDCGFYTENWYSSDSIEPFYSATAYIVGNLIAANEGKDDEDDE